uniref:Ribonuclease H protein At1g65750 family n=1 Tax=Cajanus cajan TaxID=3821 RepID=A0A151QUS9_CAJCA|nr:Putative ribonuclease H protein At1g65750 family [Cajanus cajan]
MVSNDGEWCQHLFANLIPSWLFAKVMLTPQLSSGEDRVIWMSTADGKFSTKSTYNLLMGQSAPGNRRVWNLVWQSKAHPCEKHFIWNCLNNRLVTNTFRVSRNMTTCDRCPMCIAPKEIIMHILSDSPMVCLVWHLLPLNLKDQFFYQEGILWLEENLGNKLDVRHGMKWSLIFSIALDFIWRSRNNLVFNQREFVPNLIVGGVMQKGRQLSHARELENCVTSIGKVYNGL